MKRSIASISNNPDDITSRPKRIRSSIVSKEKEIDVGMSNNREVSFDQENSVKKISQSSKNKKSNGNAVRENHLSTITNTPSQSTILFSSSSSSLKDTPIPTTPISTSNNKKSYSNTNESSSYQQNNPKSGRRYANNTAVRTLTNPNSQPVSTPLAFNKSRTNKTKGLTQTSSHNQSSTFRQLSSLNNSTTSTSNNDPVCSLVEGSLEYRELKRLYHKEKNLGEEWRKDYQILKGQMTALRSSTIPRPTAEVVEWLGELFHIMDNNGVYVGDGRTLEEIGDDLGVDPASLVTVASRTPQRSALKLFRLLYPTVFRRAECQSIAKIPREQLNNIYMYVRMLHRNLSFTLIEMRKAIGTSIRSATSELRRIDYRRQQRSDNLQNNNSFDMNETDAQTQDAINDGDSDDEDTANDENDENKDGDENEDDQDKLDDENEDDEGTNPLMIADDEDDED